MTVCYEVASLKASASQLRGDAPLADDARISGHLGRGGKADVEGLLHSEWFSGAERQASLLEWVAVNRTWSAVLMGTMMLCVFLAFTDGGRETGWALIVSPLFFAGRMPA